MKKTTPSKVVIVPKPSGTKGAQETCEQPLGQNQSELPADEKEKPAESDPAAQEQAPEE
jgi:hypothetical protein